ncbi:Uncharacterised protein [Yersinia rohdei]|nr:Uncharacterised protein [Yersinia rohdei]
MSKNELYIFYAICILLIKFFPAISLLNSSSYPYFQIQLLPFTLSIHSKFLALLIPISLSISFKRLIKRKW